MDMIPHAKGDKAHYKSTEDIPQSWHVPVISHLAHVEQFACDRNGEGLAIGKELSPNRTCLDDKSATWLCS